METFNISPFSYGILALTNPHEWPNQAECETFSHLITGKSVYVWPLVFAAYVWHLEERKGLTFDRDLERIDVYIERHFKEFLRENPVDFTNAGSQYVRSKPGSFQALRKSFGTPAKNLKIPDAEKKLSYELRLLENRGLIVDPFTTSLAGVTLAVLGSVPYSFTKRTAEGDEKYLKIKAMLWEFESYSTEEKREVRFHFFMEKAIGQLKKHVRLIAQETAD
ncbi:hypothetical protein [Leisingera sp. McT4-56]|uniref:hypothetical protein n=1 Tax=Leisingera sp. McT4-56 TaxID=2881255 RepID=UPI001CF90FB8|nr:hypothetical protein [Leisingera sp. McT4-56]MCB4458297.1 hypothetical protein [Leisingera sp. McT4-56]